MTNENKPKIWVLILVISLLTLIFTIWIFIFFNKILDLKFFLIMLPAAISDSINPCAFAIMLLLLSSMLSKSQSKIKTIFTWFCFILAVFISYYLMWIWIYSALASSTNTFYLKIIVWVMWIIIWLVNIKDYFFYWEYISLSVPDSRKPNMNKLIDKIVSPIWGFFIWILVSLFLLPCTSWPYFTIIWFLASENNSINLSWYIYLLIYNLIFIFPLFIIIILVVFWYDSIKNLAIFRKNNLMNIHLLVWVFMILLWVYIILDSI